MPSDSVMDSALAAARPRCSSFHAALARAVAQVESFLAARRGLENGRSGRAVHELGAFAAERIDACRFADLFTEHRTLDEASIQRVERAHDLLKRHLARDVPYVARVVPGGSLAATVGAALGEMGRAFAAARSIELARNGAPGHEVADPLAPFPYRRWNQAEKRIAPPLVVEVEGGDLQSGGLAEFLDGEQLLLLAVRGVVSASPLVRLITPGVTVAQLSDDGALAELASSEGPTVIALMPPGAAAFTHRAGRGPVWERLSLQSAPTTEAHAPVGSFGVFQQQQEAALLRELSTPPAEPVAPGVPASAPGSTGEAEAGPSAPTPPDPADQLAAWLLEESGLPRG